MKRLPSLLGLGLGLVAFGAACGASSPTDATESPPAVTSASVDPYCHDGTLAGAATPALGFCSDGSHRAPTVAPQDPVLVWQRKVTTKGDFLVDAHGVIHGSDVSVYPNGPSRSAAVLLGVVAFLDRDGNLVWRERQGSAMVVGVRTPAGQLLRTMRPAQQGLPDWDIAGGAVDDGAVDVVHRSRGPMSSSIGWIERIDDHGSTWTAATGCNPVDSDRSRPATTIRTADGGAASACGSTPVPNVVVNVFDRNGARTASISLPALSIASNLAQLPTGDLALVTLDVTSLVLWTLREGGVTSRTRILRGGAAYLAVARDGALVVRTSTELFAFTPTAPEATLRFRAPAAVHEVWESLGGVGSIPLFVDAGATVVTWGDDAEARSLVDGKLLWAFPGPPKSAIVYVTAAGPRAVYVLSSDGTLTLLRDR